MRLLCLAGLFLGSAAACAQQARTVTVQVLAINDLHGNLEPPAGRDGQVNQVPAGGAEYLATHLKMAEAAQPNSILVGAGDLFGASPLLSALFQEQPTIEAVNAMGLAVTSIGNHEMDKGTATLKERLKTAKFEYLAANVLQDGKPIFPGTSVRIVGGVKIGFIGETLESSPQVISANAIKDDTFQEESRVANAAAAALERAGVHTIVLLIHQGGAQHSGANPQDVNGCADFSGPIQQIAEKLSPAIQVVISAHTHQYYNCRIAGHTVTSAGAYGRMFTRISLTIDRRTDRLLEAAATNEVVTRDVEKDPAMTAIIAKYKPVVEKVSNQVEGSITAAISKRENDVHESAMGDVIADAQLAEMSAPEKGGAVIAFMNSGGIRADLATPGDVTFGQLYAVQPFGNRLTVHTMSGAVLKKLLEQQFSGGGTQLLQISNGLTYQFKASAPAGQHVVAGSVMLNGKPVADTDVLKVAASDFVAAGSGSLTAFREATDPVLGPVDLDALVNYFKAHSPVAPGPQNRIVKVD